MPRSKSVETSRSHIIWRVRPPVTPSAQEIIITRALAEGSSFSDGENRGYPLLKKKTSRRGEQQVKTGTKNLFLSLCRSPLSDPLIPRVIIKSCLGRRPVRAAKVRHQSRDASPSQLPWLYPQRRHFTKVQVCQMMMSPCQLRE